MTARRARNVISNPDTHGSVKSTKNWKTVGGATISFGLIGLCLGGCNQGPFRTSPYATAVEVNPELRGADVQKSYNQGFKNDYIAISGTELLKNMILDSLERFVMALRARSSDDDLRQNLTSFGYFSQSTSIGLQEVCDPSRRFTALAALRGWNSPYRLPCSDHSPILPVQLGYDGRVFVVPASNHFATAIDLAALRRALTVRKGAVRWSDLDSRWPNRPIRWIFPAPFAFGLMFRELGSPAPSRFLLADTYSNSYQHIEDHPDNLLVSHASIGLGVRLQGFRFRTLPVREHPDAPAVTPSLANLESRYPRLLTRRVVLYINTANTNSCILGAFARYAMRHNRWLMSENNFAPLSVADRKEQISLLPADLTRQIPGSPAALCAAYNNNHASLNRGAEGP